MEIAIWCAGTGLLAGIAVFAWQASARRKVESELIDTKGAAILAEARLKDLADQQSQLATTHQALSADHLRLNGERERLATQLAQQVHLATIGAQRSESLQKILDETAKTLSHTDSELRVVRTQLDTHIRSNDELQRSLEATAGANRSQQSQIGTLAADLAATSKDNENLRARLSEQKAWIEDQTKLVQERFGSIATRLMEEKAVSFTELNRKELDAIVTPFKEQLNEFRQRVDNIHTTDSRDRGVLHQQIEQLTKLNQTVSRRAEELTNALTITSKATGDWGETILQKILEDSGLRADEEYVLQHSMNGSEGETQQPDAVVFLPEKRQIVIDSKVSNKAWKAYCSATDDEEKAATLAEHLKSLRTHVKGLSSKDYSRSPDLNTVDFVLMFVPVEAALLTALAHDDSLYTEAFRSKIVLVAPSTLMAVIKLIEGMWVFQNRKESVEEIAEAGRKLYEKLSTFSNSFVEIGAAIERTNVAFQKAKGQLSTGKGNAIRLAERMKELGVDPAGGKAIAAELAALESSDRDEESADTSDA